MVHLYYKMAGMPGEIKKGRMLMKKFLSLVLTLALTLSLVVLPARAGASVDVTGLSITGDATAYPGQSKTYSVTGTPVIADATDVSVTAWDWTGTSGFTGSSTTGSLSATAGVAGSATIKCTVTVKYTLNGGTEITTTKELTKEVTVADKYELTVSADKTTLYYNGTDAYKTATLTPTLTKNGGAQAETTDYTVEVTESSDKLETNGKTVSVASAVAAAESNITVTVNAKVGDNTVATKTVAISVADRYSIDVVPAADKTVTVTKGNTKTLTAPVLKDALSAYPVNSSEYTLSYGCENTNIATVGETSGVVTGKTVGDTTATATITYGSKEYKVNYNVKVNPITLDITLDEVENGDYDYLYASDLKSAAAAALQSAVPSYSGNKTVTSLTVNSGTVTGGKLYKEDGTTAITSGDNLVGSAVSYTKFAATAGHIGKVAYTITAVIDGESYTGTMTVPVVSAGDIDEDIYAYATSSSNASYEMPSGYDKIYYTESKPSNYEGYKSWTAVDGGKTISVSVSKFNSGKITLYCVGTDDGVAYTGTITVYLENYDIEYSGVAGETITFDQDDFDDFMEEAAEDYGWINTSKSSTAYVEFDHVTFSIPAEKTQGILYNDGEQIKSNSKAAVKECENLDKVTFAIANKSGLKEVAINFTLYADYYSSDKVTKPATKTFSGRVVVSVVSEDIKYTVPVDGSVTFKPYDFEDFYTDTYKNGTLSYVKFTELPKVADGALYATYSTLYAGTLAKTGDKFYYDSNKITDLDLDDVTFRTSLWTKTGTKVYLPFEAYGTTSKNSKTVSSTPVKGCVVITVTAAKTMNFTDVKSGDWYYDNVKNAYTMGLIEGKTATTFNPNDNMTYAEAVTLAARMNELYNTGKVTLENSKTGNWYSSYESYAISKGIISSYLGTKANTKITRRDYVEIFYNALPASAYTVKNTITKIPDLANDSTNAKIYTFYKAGILTGYANTPGKTTGSFGANDNIKRSEVATILIRMMDASTRMYFTL